ncbi:MAG: 50S ribosomal protein L23 [Magnetococcales bacterium]|nr:50S ribosomal protein L23 [Magnetococcales bacterium]
MSDPYTLYTILDAPRITEKATLCQEKDDQVIFKVQRSANKAEIKAAVEKMFGVKVIGVQTSNVKGKIKRFGRTVGRRKDWKKAVVRLEAGQGIDFFQNK